MIYKNIYNQLEEDKNNKGNNRILNKFTNPNKKFVLNSGKIRNNDIEEKEEENYKENGGEKEEEKTDKNNYFRKRKN